MLTAERIDVGETDRGCESGNAVSMQTVWWGVINKRAFPLAHCDLKFLLTCCWPDLPKLRLMKVRVNQQKQSEMPVISLISAR